MYQSEAELEKSLIAHLNGLGMESKPKIEERKTVFQRVLDGLMDIVSRFDEGMEDV